jgi:uridine phosphorylase
MVYPKLMDKQIEEALFSASDRYKEHELKGKLPKKIIFIYMPSLLNYIKRKYKPKKMRVNKIVSVYQHKDIGFVRMKGLGSPHAVVVLEELISLGCTTFLNVGTAGGLHKTGVFICNKSLRDEGTSYHYKKHGDYSYPDNVLKEKIKSFFRKKGFEFQEGTSWTIDAIYRETKKEVEKYSKIGICTVEMESSALFSVAKYRNVKLASIFIVRDVLGKKWDNRKWKNVESLARYVLDLSAEFLRGIR